MIPINKPLMGEEEKREVTSVLEENALTTAARDGGKRVRDFESLMKNYLKMKHVVSVNSGTSALYAALLAAGIKQGDEVLIPSFTFVATANAVVAAGGKPMFVVQRPQGAHALGKQSQTGTLFSVADHGTRRLGNTEINQIPPWLGASVSRLVMRISRKDLPATDSEA